MMTRIAAALAAVPLLLRRPGMIAGLAQILAGLAVLLGSQDLALVAAQLAGVEDAVMASASDLAGLGLVIGGLVTPLLRRRPPPA